jgi:hypothetical protein
VEFVEITQPRVGSRPLVNQLQHFVFNCFIDYIEFSDDSAVGPRTRLSFHHYH